MSPARMATRARRLLGVPGSWMEATPDGGYVIRTGRDRRARVMLSVDEATFAALVAEPGLRTRRGGGWSARPAPVAAPSPPPGRPGWVEGERIVMAADGRPAHRRANLAQTAVDWLARRSDADGRPWLGPAEVAAATRLALDVEIALAGPSVTLRWDALPRAGAGGGPHRAAGPGAQALAAERRLEAALAACGGARAMVVEVCVRASPLQAAERTLGLRRRSGKAMLCEGLQALARHYRIGAATDRLPRHVTWS